MRFVMDRNNEKIETETDRIFREAAGPIRYPSWFYIGGLGLKGGMDRFVSCFFPWTIKK